MSDCKYSKNLISHVYTTSHLM